MGAQLATVSDTVLTTGMGGASILLALAALGFAYFQTRQLNAQILKLEHTETQLAEARTSISELSREMYEVLGLTQAAQTTPQLLRRLTEIANNCGEVLPSKRPYLPDFLNAKIDDLVSFSSAACAGALELRPSDVARVALELVDEARDSEALVVTSYVSAEDFWDRGPALDYLARNKELIERRKVEITRIFLFDTEDQATRSHSEMDKQDAARIKVRTALTSSLEADLARDMFLLGDRLAAEYALTPTGANEILGVHIWTPPSREIAVVAGRMERLLRASKEYVPTSRNTP